MSEISAPRRRVIFVCVENSNRSQMAEAFARIHGGDKVEAFSAGSRPSGRINPTAIEAMKAVGYDLTSHASKGLEEFNGMAFDAAVTMGCGDECPLVRAKQRVDWQIPDPKNMPPEEFNAVRDRIEKEVIELLAGLKDIQDIVKEQYGQVANSTLSSHDGGVQAVAEAFGYSTAELAAIPAEANMGLSCGNPTAMASLQPGEVVIDLGCGGGLDVFLAAQKVGPNGKAIGIDMTPEMIARAKKNAARGAEGKPFTNVEFHLAAIDKLPLPDASVDVVISNCVINLAPDKPAVFREIARVLKPGGRLAISDIALKKPLPPEIARDVMAYVGCIAGAITIAAYEMGLREAGFQRIAVINSGSDLNAYAKVEGQGACCSPAMSSDPAGASSASCMPSLSSSGSLSVAASSCGGTTPANSRTAVHEGLTGLLNRYDVNDYAASVKVHAMKAE